MPIVITAFGKRFDMVDGIGRGKPSRFIATNAQRISRKKSGTNFTPLLAISFVCFWVSLKLVIIFHVFFGVCDAVAV